MGYQTTFKRYEIKYLLDSRQKQVILEALKPYMQLDQYGRTTIRNIYFDTDHYRLIRHSLEKPVYKEKLRLRSYQKVEDNDLIFVELKKKYQKVVYKRRLVLPQDLVMDCFRQQQHLPLACQIADEINYFRDYYENLSPKVFLSYEREAFYALDGSDFRLTFDENILYRQDDLTLESDIYGIPLLAPDQTLMEIKTIGGMPLWLSHVLNHLHLYQISFSKYGAAYQDIQKITEDGGM